MSFALAQYRSARTQTASPVQIVVDLYEGALKFLNQAVTHDAAGRVGDRGVALSRAHAIVSELSATLDHEAAPELCAELERLYEFVMHRVTEANLHADTSLLHAAIETLTTLRAAWAELAGRT